MNSSHIIRDFNVQISFPSEDAALAESSTLSSFVSERLVSVAHEVFNEFAKREDCFIEIPMIDIELGEIPLRGYCEEAESRFRKRLEEWLLDELNGYRLHPQDKPMGMARVHGSERALELTLHWLEHGYLPWNAQLTNGQSIEQAIEMAVRIHGTELVHRMKASINAHAMVRRLAMHPSENLKSQFSKLLGIADTRARLAPQRSNDWENLYLQSLGDEPEGIAIESAIREAVVTGNPKPSPKAWGWMLQEHVGLVEAVVRKEGRRREVRHVMATQLDERTLGDIVRLLEPVESSFVNEVTRRPVLFAEAAKARTEREAETKANLWEIVLTYLVSERGTQFNRRSFLRSMVLQMASHYNQDYLVLAESLCTSFAMVHVKSQIRSEVLQVLKGLCDEARHVSGAQATKGSFDRKDRLDTDVYSRSAILEGNSDGSWAQTGDDYSEARTHVDDLVRLIAEFPVISDLIASRAPSAALAEFLKTADPGIFEFLQDLAGAVESVCGNQTEGFPTAEDASRLVWTVATRCVLEKPGDSDLDKADFLAWVLTAFATRYGLDRDGLVSAAIRTLSRVQIAGQSQNEIAELLHSLDRGKLETVGRSTGAHWEELIESALRTGRSHAVIDAWKMCLQGGFMPARDLLRRLFQTESKRRQLMNSLPLSLSRETAVALFPAEIVFIEKVSHFVEVFNEEELHDSKPVAQRMVWEFTFLYAVTERGSTFNKNSYLETVMGGLAAHYNLNFDDLMRTINGLRQVPNVFRAVPEELWTLLASWQAEADDTTDGAAAENEAIKSSLRLSIREGYEIRNQIDQCTKSRDAEAELNLLLERVREEAPWMWRRMIRESKPVQAPERDWNPKSNRCEFIAGIGWIVFVEPSEMPDSVQNRPDEEARPSVGIALRISCETVRSALEDALVASVEELLSSSGNSVRPLLRTLSKDTRAVRILARVLTDCHMADLARICCGAHWDRFLRIAELIADAANLTDRCLFWEIVFAEINRINSSSDEAMFVAAFVGRLARATNRSSGDLSRLLSRSLRRECAPQLQAASLRLAATVEESAISLPSLLDARPRRTKKRVSGKRQPVSMETHGDAIFISNAGQVLISPFLPRLFDMVGLVDQGQFKDEKSAHRAVLLIQFAVDGLLETCEHALPLNKILCGLDVSEPVDCNPTLKQEEMDACDGLLAAIIDHWKAVGNTSVQGLRESFLQREGRIAASARGWQLLVQSRAFDMLLDRLPWSFGVIKHPWMTTPLHVEWR